MTVTNSTIASNEADFDGGGIRASGSTFSGNGLTIAQNRADHDGNATGLGGGIHAAGGTFDLANSSLSMIYAGNGYMYDAPHAGTTVGLHAVYDSNVIFRRLV